MTEKTSTRKKYLDVNEMIERLEKIRLEDCEQIPRAGFHPENPGRYGRACAYDMALRLVRSCRKEGHLPDTALVWKEIGRMLTTCSGALIRYCIIMGMKYKVYCLENQEETGWLGLENQTEVWCWDEGLSFAADALCAYLAYRGLPLICRDGGDDFYVLPDFSEKGVFLSVGDMCDAWDAFVHAFAEIEEDIFAKSSCRKRMNPESEEFIIFNPLAFLVLPPEAIIPETVPEYREFVSYSEADLGMKARVFNPEKLPGTGMAVPETIRPLGEEAYRFACFGTPPSFCSELACETVGLSSGASGKHSDAKKKLFVSLFGKGWEHSLLDGFFTFGEDAWLPDSDDISGESFLPDDFSLRDWIEKEFRSAVENGWEGNERMTGRLRALTGLRLAASRIKKDPELFITVSSFCMALDVFGTEIFFPAGIVHRTTPRPQDLCLSIFTDFAESRGYPSPQFPYSRKYGEWPFGTGIFPRNIENALAVIYAQGVRTSDSGKKLSAERVEGYVSVYKDLYDLLFDRDGGFRNEVADRVGYRADPEWCRYFLREGFDDV